MNKPEPLTLEEIHQMVGGHFWGSDTSYNDVANAIKAAETEVNRRWIEMLGKQQPVAWITPDGVGFRIRFSAPTQDIPLGWGALYAHPAPQQKPQKLLLEHSGCGQGTQVEQMIVRLNRGDKVVLLMGPYTAATEAKK
jgi:hypothetical protein